VQAKLAIGECGVQSVIGKAFFLILFVGLGLLTIRRALPGQDKPEVCRCDTTAATVTQSDIKVEIRRLVHTYVQSIVDADTKLGATVWSPTPDVSFIEPRGNEQGWEQIAAVFYGKTMGETFTKRTLKLVGEVNIQWYGSAAVAEFNWDFVATIRANGQTIHTTGRESQVYINLPNKGWRLVHVHYSGPPIGGPGQGF
jgi:hypothetical protein